MSNQSESKGRSAFKLARVLPFAVLAVSGVFASSAVAGTTASPVDPPGSTITANGTTATYGPYSTTTNGDWLLTQQGFTLTPTASPSESLSPAASPDATDFCYATAGINTATAGVVKGSEAGTCDNTFTASGNMKFYGYVRQDKEYEVGKTVNLGLKNGIASQTVTWDDTQDSWAPRQSGWVASDLADCLTGF